MPHGMEGGKAVLSHRGRDHGADGKGHQMEQAVQQFHHHLEQRFHQRLDLMHAGFMAIAPDGFQGKADGDGDDEEREDVVVQKGGDEIFRQDLFQQIVPHIEGDLVIQGMRICLQPGAHAGLQQVHHSQADDDRRQGVGEDEIKQAQAAASADSGAQQGKGDGEEHERRGQQPQQPQHHFTHRFQLFRMFLHGDAEDEADHQANQDADKHRGSGIQSRGGGSGGVIHVRKAVGNQRHRTSSGGKWQGQARRRERKT